MAIIINDANQTAIFEEELMTGEVVICATETVYGFIAKTTFPNAKEKIYKLKDRSKDKPLSALLTSVEEFEWFTNIDSSLFQDIKDEVEAGSTIICKVKDKYKSMFEGMDVVGFRIPQGPIKSIIKNVGPCWATSVNKTNEEPMNDPEEINSLFGEEIGFILATGEQTKKPSKVIDVTNGSVKVVRD